MALFTACRFLFVERFFKSTDIVLIFTLGVNKVSELEWHCSLTPGSHVPRKRKGANVIASTCKHKKTQMQAQEKGKFVLFLTIGFHLHLHLCHVY